MNNRLLAIVLLSILVSSCIYPFEPTVVEQTSGIIVIEGDIVSGDESFFYVSVSQNLTDATDLKYIACSSLEVESSNGTILRGYNSSRGAIRGCAVDTRNLDSNQEYRLHASINNRDYYSQWQSLKYSPPIDSLSFYPDLKNGKMKVYVSTHGKDSVGYYKWTYREDWEYHVHYNSFYQYVPDSNLVINVYGISSRYYCWNYDYSSSIMVANTSNLTQNRLINQEIFYIDRTNIKLSELYSVEVYQTAIDKQAYVYWTALLKNTDQVGGLFDPQPNELRGNIYCSTDTNEFVLGYIGASTVTKKRLFIDQKNTLFWLQTSKCEKPLEVDRDSWPRFYRIGWDIVDVSENEFGNPIYLWSPARCVDCTKMGGTKNKPSFWPSDHK